MSELHAPILRGAHLQLISAWGKPETETETETEPEPEPEPETELRCAPRQAEQASNSARLVAKPSAHHHRVQISLGQIDIERFVQAHPISAAAFGVVQGLVGAVDHVVGAF